MLAIIFLLINSGQGQPVKRGGYAGKNHPLGPLHDDVKIGRLRRLRVPDVPEYMVYLNDKPVVIICDDRPMVKMLPCLEELLRGRPTEPPYEGAKDHYLLDPDDRDTLREAVRLAEEATPLPKKKAPKQKEPAPAEGPAPWDIVWPQHMKPGLSDIGACPWAGRRR